MNDSTKKRLILGAIILIVLIILIAVIIGSVKNKDNVTTNFNQNTSAFKNNVKIEDEPLKEPDVSRTVRGTND